MKILNLQETYLSEVISNLDTIKEQGFDAIQLDVLDYLEKNRNIINNSALFFDFSGIELDVRDELGTKSELKKLCEEAGSKSISVFVKIKNTTYLGHILDLLKKRINLLLYYKQDKFIDLVGMNNKSEEEFAKMLINYQKENGLLNVREIFELYKTSIFSDENSKELTTYLHELANLGVKGFVFDDTLSKETKLGERLSVYLRLNRVFCYKLNHRLDNLEEYYEFKDSDEQIMEAQNEISYDIARKLSEHVIFTPRHKDEGDYWNPDVCYKNPQYEIARFKDEYRFSRKIREANSGRTLTKTNI